MVQAPDERTRFVAVADVAAFDQLLARSQDETVLLFLHDPGCPISAAAHRQMGRLGGELPTVDVRHEHDVSRAVERATGVRHESPQLLVLRSGQAVWSASHFAITTKAVAEASQGAA